DFQRNLVPADAGDGVSTYLALTFGTLLSSQGTDASFVLTLAGFPPGASLRCFQPYQIVFRDPAPCWSGVRFPVRPLRAFPFGGSDFIRSSSGPCFSKVAGGSNSFPIPCREGCLSACRHFNGFP
ncbi:hypothetical protein C3486_23055, partial [Streptomyces sp. Ru73]